MRVRGAEESMVAGGFAGELSTVAVDDVDVTVHHSGPFVGFEHGHVARKFVGQPAVVRVEERDV